MIRSGAASLSHAPYARKGLCGDCALLDLKVVGGGRVVYWCERKKRALSDGYVWRSICSHYIPIQRET